MSTSRFYTPDTDFLTHDGTLVHSGGALSVVAVSVGTTAPTVSSGALAFAVVSGALVVYANVSGTVHSGSVALS